MLLDIVRIVSLARLDSQQLALVVPFEKSCILIEALVALKANELRMMCAGQRPRDFSLADSRFAFQQERAAQHIHQPERGRKIAIGNVTAGSKPLRDPFS